MGHKSLPTTDKHKEDSYQEPVVKAPQTIVCPNSKCQRIIGKLIADLHQGTKLRSSMFTGPMIRPGGSTKCHNCGMPWFLTNPGIVHTIEGWKPSVN